MRPTLLTILNMESVVAKIKEHFGENYLINERQTYQGQMKLQKLKLQDSESKREDFLL